ncbi:uncharacterized protein si:ch211-57n23.1 [Clupea harengus]|uniref:Uncharacterized protein si:ch211-57n23.1 n=1 Tax=Clupea harengus TaxID=7950 RepID=A0A6P3W4X6_CLUHA|nr:uncharacterized protein si:ch211-57n23.1 [Clupea harengus]
MLFFREGVGQTWLPMCLLLCVWCPVLGQELDQTLADWDDWGSGLQDLLLAGFPADSPFVSETPDRPANCTQRFWLPPSYPVCWDDVVGQEEFEQTRLLALQNRAALQAVSLASGLDEGGLSNEEQARQDVQGVQADHQEVVQTADTMEKVFFSLEEKRREGTEHYTFSSIKEQLTNTRASLHSRGELAALLEEKLSVLERSLDLMQLRLAKLLARRW